jgi:hypothetical protein
MTDGVPSSHRICGIWVGPSLVMRTDNGVHRGRVNTALSGRVGIRLRHYGAERARRWRRWRRWPCLDRRPMTEDR